jgi:hypothetical protein
MSHGLVSVAGHPKELNSPIAELDSRTDCQGGSIIVVRSSDPVGSWEAKDVGNIR